MESAHDSSNSQQCRKVSRKNQFHTKKSETNNHELKKNLHRTFTFNKRVDWYWLGKESLLESPPFSLLQRSDSEFLLWFFLVLRRNPIGMKERSIPLVLFSSSIQWSDEFIDRVFYWKAHTWILRTLWSKTINICLKIAALPTSIKIQQSIILPNNLTQENAYFAIVSVVRNRSIIEFNALHLWNPPSIHDR